MITVISTIKTIKTHISITGLATRGALLALFAGLFILAACGGGGGVSVNVAINVPTPGCIDPFAEGCGDAGAGLRAEAINTCRRDLIERNEACADTIPDAVIICLTDPYKDSCDVEAYNAAIRTTDSRVLIGALQTGRTNDCRGRSLAGARLCDGAIDNTCQPVSRATDATRNQLILDNLCNNAPNYLTARQNFVTGCTNKDLLFNNAGCTQIVTCTTEPFGDGCDVDVFAGYRAVQCHESSAVNTRCGSENIIANYCADNLFIETAGCVSNPAFDSARITECTTGNNGVQARCQNTGIFKTAGITECFVDPYGADCDDIEGYNVRNAQNSRKAYCTGIGTRAGGDNMFCAEAISNVCEGGSADIFDPLCFATAYQTLREDACKVTDLNDVRCTATVAQLCANNPFTQTVGGQSGDLCTDADDARAALVTRCAIETSDKTGCINVSVGAVDLQECIADPYVTGCEDAAFDDIKTARYNNCVGQDSADFVCTGVEATICQSDSGKVNPLANPFFSLCRAPGTNYGAIRTAFCGFRTLEDIPECKPNFVTECNDDPFDSDCITTDAYELDRAVIITACLAEIEAGTQAASGSACSNSVDNSGTTVGDCAADPFATANGCSTNGGFARTRTARVALCAATATPFDSVCNSFAGIDAARDTHCETAETSFSASCDDPAYPGTRALRISFCTQPANLFTPLCTGAEAQLSLDNTRTALVLACSENAATAGCDQFANGVFGATIADCTGDLFNSANGCFTNTSFAALRRTRTTLCETAGQQFNPLCTDFPEIKTAKQTYCTVGAGSFDANCELDYAESAATARVDFARLCRSTTTPRDDCADTIVSGDVSVADCVANPYRLECYGTETARNPDFIKEVEERDILCTSGDIYSDLCTLNGEEIIEGVKAARSDRCTTPSVDAFNDNCVDEDGADVYAGANAARRQYCSTDAQRSDVSGDGICGSYEASICGDTGVANPFAAICGGDNSANQMTFCGLPQNLAGAPARAVQCTNDPTLICPNDPFNQNAGVSGTVDCLMDSGAYNNQRAARCATGSEGAGNNCNTAEIAALVCVVGLPTSNPFASFCEDVMDINLGALKTARESFADACARVGAIGNCVAETVQNALCAGDGEFLRPFSAVCDGVETATAARVSFCGKGDNVTNDVTKGDCSDNEVIVSDCRTDPFSTPCKNTGESYIDELRALRAEYCESLTVADDLCSAVAQNDICTGYTVASGAVAAKPLVNLCAENSLYDDPRRDACLALNSKNAVCDDIPAVTEACRDNPFADATPGCALISTAEELQMDWCEIGTNTWLSACDDFAEASEGVNGVATARTNACLAGTSGDAEDCKALESVMTGCQASPFANIGCSVFDEETLAGYELAYCSLEATAWEEGCNDLVDAQISAVALARTRACTLEAVVPTNAGSRCNDVDAVRILCESTPLAPNFLGCAFLDKFEEYVTDYCTGDTTWHVDCDIRAELDGGDNDIFRARRTACLTSADVASFPDTDCPMVTINYCGDTENSANAFDAGCSLAVFPSDGTTLEKQRQKACAEGGLGVNDFCTDKEFAKVHCTTVNPYAGVGCEELAGDQGVMNFRATYCTDNAGATGCGEVAEVCMENPFDGRCVDAAGSDYADARKARADACRLPSPTEDCTRVNACNARPFGATPAHFPVDLTPTTCSTDPAFADARAALITKCIEINAVRDDPDCANAVDDQNAVSGVSCLGNPFEANCTSLTQLGDNVTEARDNYCRTTTGMNSFNPSCDGTNTFVMQARVDSCLHSDSAHGTCPMLITGFCTATTGLTAFDDRCIEGEGNHRDGNTFLRTTLCANGANHEKCTETGDSFATWRDDSGVTILKAGAGVTSATTNFINGVLNATDKLHLGDNSLDVDIIATTHVVRLNDSSGSVTLRGDQEDGFVFARADVDDSSTDKFFAGILHTTDLGKSIESNVGRALWKGVIQAFRFDGTDSYIHNADFVLSIDFDAGTIAFDGFQGAVTLLGGASLRVSIVDGTSFNKTTGLITGQVLFADNTLDSNKTSTGTLRGVIGGEGVVAVFATPTVGNFDHFVGGFVASSRDRIAVCQDLNTNPFGEGCDREDGEVSLAQLKACSTGTLGSGLSVDAADCNHIQLSGVICSDNISGNSDDVNPFARICSDDAITIFHSVMTATGFSPELTDLDGDGMTDFDDVRQKVRNHCADVRNSQATVCTARQARIVALSSRCVAGDLPTLFDPLCSSYREFVDVQALVCRNRADKVMTTLAVTDGGFACNTKYIIANICRASGEAGNPFDVGICGNDGKHAMPNGTYAGARGVFAGRCAGDLANDPSVTSGLDGANCLTSGVDQACLENPFSEGCKMNTDYDVTREDRKFKCRGHETVTYRDVSGNIFNYDCDGAIIDACGTTAMPTDDDLFSDKLCTNSDGYDTRRAQIVKACDDAGDPTTDVNCLRVVASGIDVNSCFTDPYQEECAHAAFGGARTAGRSDCETTFMGADCVAVQTSVCGAGVYADNPFDPFCDKKDAANSDATIKPAILADGRNKYCQDSTNRANQPGCAEFLNRPTTAALLDAQTNELDDSPNPTTAANEFLRGTEDGLNTSGFVQKDGRFSTVSTLNLKTSTYESSPLSGDAADGVAFFAGRQHKTQGDIATEVDYYAGILSGTDLGNPLPRQYSDTGQDLTVEWNGRIGWLIYDAEQARGFALGSSTNGVRDFTLTINLTARTIRAHIARIASLYTAYGFLLDGNYDENGVISGVARYGLTVQGGVPDADYTGSLIGLIGEQGAVGAFHLTGSGAEDGQGASGGFVVSSRATAGSDEVNPSPGSFNYWIANRRDADDDPIDVLGRAEEINVNNPFANFIAAGGATGQLDVGDGGDFGTVQFSDQSPDGLGYGFANYGTTNNRNERFYVGLFASTDLGAPRPERAGSASVNWNGRLAIAKQDPQGASRQSYLTTVDDFKLKISFTDEGGTIETLDSQGIALTDSIFEGALALDRFLIAGTFDRNGLLRGTTTYRAFDGSTLSDLDGILTGLIGVEGVAGVFTSVASGAGTVGHYVGGFVASSALDTGGADTWQTNALRPDGATDLTVKNGGTAVLADNDYNFIASGNDTLDLGNAARKSATLTKELKFNENLTLRNGDVFSLNSDADGGISIAQAEFGGNNIRQLYAGLLGDTFVGAPLESQPSVNWRGVLSIIAGTTPALHTTDFTLSVDFATGAIYSNTVFLRVAGDLDHNIILQGRFNDQGVIYGTATYQTGEQSNAGELTGLIGVIGASAVFGGDSTSDLGQFIGGLVAVPSGTSETTPNSHFVWVEGIDETEFRGTQFNTDVPQVSTTQQPVTLLDTTYLGGVGNGDGSTDGFAFFLDTESIRQVGIFAGTHLGGPVTAADATANWHARMVGIIIAGGSNTNFNANFTLNVRFDERAISTIAGELPTFVDAGTEYTFTFDGAIKWDEITGLFTGGITLNADVGEERTKGGILRGIIGEQGAVGAFKVSAEGTTGRTFVGGFVAVPEAIGAARGQTSYWAEYARNADNTAGLNVRGVRGAKLSDGIYTVIEGGLETLELGVAVDKNTDPDLTYDLKFANTEVSPDGSSFNIDSTVDGGISFYATETRFGKYYAGLLSGTDVGRLLTRTTPSAIWVGRFGVIYGTTSFDNTLDQKDFELAINFDARTLKSHNPDDTASLTDADAITFLEAGGFSYELIIDGEYNDRGIIYGTTTLQDNDGSALSNVSAGTLTGLIGEKGAAAVFHRTGGNIRYVGGFVAVPNKGPGLTNVQDNIPASYNTWTFLIDKTKQKDTSSGTDVGSADNTAVFTTEIPETPSQTNQLSFNLVTLGGQVEDGFIGYADDNARQIGLLSSVELGGVPLETGTATWTGVMQWILGDGEDGIIMQSFELSVDFDARTLTFGDIEFTSNTVDYALNFGLVQWVEKSGLVTGTMTIATTDTTPEQSSLGLVRGLIGQEGVVVAFRSTSAAHTSFTGGFVAREITKSETTFSEHFSSTAGGEVLENFVNNGTAKFAEVTDGNKLLLDGGATAPSGFYSLGASAVNTGSNPNGFIYSTNTSNLAVGILSTTDLGTPLPLEKTGVAEWTGRLYISNAGLRDDNIVLNVNFTAGTIITKAAVNINSTGNVTVDGYFGLNPQAVAANLPLGLLAGTVTYHRSGTPWELALIGQIGQTGVVGIYGGLVNTTQLVGGFAAFSSEVTANAREFITRQGFNLADGVNQIDITGSAFQYVNKDGNIFEANPNHRFGLGGDNTPSVTNPNGFTIGAGGFGLSVGIWANTDLGLLLPQTPNAFATWTGKIHTLRYNAKSGGRRTVAAATVESDFTIQVNFERRKISTVSAVDNLGAVTLGAVDLTGGDTFHILNVDFDGNGIIGCTSACTVDYTVSGITYGLNLVGVIGEKGALGVFRGPLSNSTDISTRQDSRGIAGGFQVTPDGRVRKVAPPPRVVVITPKQLNYAAYLKYYQTDYVTERHGTGVNAVLASKESQFVEGLGDGTGLNTGTNTVHHANDESFSPYAVYLNGEDDSTSNGFVLIGASFSATADSGLRNYAGLLAGADVGRFSDALADTTATWQGRFYSSAITVGTSSASRIPTRLPLTLTVNFGAGTIGTLGDVRLLNDHVINIAGTFGFARDDADQGIADQGILGGFITYTDPSAFEGQRITRAPIYGIIGDAGALGVFASGKYGVTGTGGDSPLVGGFEVSPNPVATANYQVFVDYVSKQTNGLQLFNTVTQNSSILRGTRTGLVQTGIASDSCTGNNCIKRLGYQTIRLAGNPRSPSGFAIMVTKTAGEGRGYSYGGLLSGTDLGAVLPIRFASGSPKAIWHGSFYVTTNKIERPDSFFDTLLHHPLSLTVDLAAGTLRTVDLLGNLGTVALTPTTSVRIDGRFGLNPTTAKQTYGLLLGDVRFDNTNYALTGLIGVEGAIGIFRISNKQTTHVTFGGFEVSPPPPPAYGRANYAVFENFYSVVKVSEDMRYVAGSGSITANKAQFVRGTQIGLVNHALTGTLESGSFAPLTVYLGGDVYSGNAFVIENFNGTHVAGLLASTDLGAAPHASLATATWLGNFYVSNNVIGTDTSAPAPFEIKSGVVVNFAAGTLTSSQATYTLANNEFISFGIYGEFGRINELPLGILAGVIKYGHDATSGDSIVTADLPLIGLIGREGALGVFRDPSNNNLVGGFEAGISTDYDVFFEGAKSAIRTGILISPSRHSTSVSIQRSNIHEVNDAGTGLKAEGIKYDTTGTPPALCCEWPTKPTGTQIAGFADGTKYGFGDDAESLSGFILVGTDVTTIKTNTSHSNEMLRVVGAGFLKTTTLGAVISDIVGSAIWRGNAYVLDTVDDTTKVFELEFSLNFARGTFNTAGAVDVTRKIGTDGTTVTSGQGGQTLLVEGKFGQGSTAFSAGFLTSGRVLYYNGDETAVETNALYGLIGRNGAVGIFAGGGQAGANNGYAGGFWAKPGATVVTTAPEVKYATYLEFYRAEIKDSVDITASPSGRVEFFNGTIGATGGLVVQQNVAFRLGGADDTLATNKNGISFNVFTNLKTVGLLGNADLGVINPNTKASATWLGRLFVKTDETAFNRNTDQKQVGLQLDFAAGTITTALPVEFSIGEETHSVSILGSFGLHEFARGSRVRPTSGLLSGFVTYTHHARPSVNVPLIGLIGVEGALGIFKSRVAGIGVGVVGGFEVSPIPSSETNLPNHDTYARQFKGYVSDTFGNFPNQISLGEATALKRGTSIATPITETFRLGGTTDTGNANYGDGFAFVKFTGSGNKSVGLLSGTDLGAVVSGTAKATWSGRLVVHYAKTAADTKNSQLDLQVDFGAGTIETLAPISIVTYIAPNGPTLSTRKQTVEVRGRFGSHLDALGLRTGILGGSIVYKVGHLTPAEAAALTSSNEVTRNSVTTAHLPLLGLIGVEGAIGVFHGSVKGVGIVGGFEVSPRAALTTPITASFERWARGATECGDIDTSENTTIILDNECAIVEHTALAFAHPNDLFESDNDLTAGVRPVSKGFVLGSDKATGIDFSDALSPIPADAAIRILTLGGDNFGSGDVLFGSTGKRFSFSGDNIGTSLDGIAFVTHYGTGTTFYAGLLSTTDLGAPLTTSSQLVASWPGRFVLEWYNDLYQTNDFVLDVNFTNSTISTAGVNVANLDWILQGRYDASGIITGIIKNTAENVTRIGTLTGLIGVEGAVGTFFIDEKASIGQNISFVGGFVAAPVGTISGTSYTHFDLYHKAQTEQRLLHADLTTGGDASLLAGDANGLGLNIAVTGDAVFNPLATGGFQSIYYLDGGSSRAEGQPRTGADEDGFVVLRGTLSASSSDGIKYRAGILAGTDLGSSVNADLAPASADVTALWTGIGYIIHSSGAGASKTEPFATEPLNFSVDFVNGTIRTVANSIGDSGEFGAVVGATNRFGVRGTFGGALLPGILGGTVTYGLAEDDTEDSIMELSGLIGRDGVIGVFANEASASLRYAGGFSARPFALTPAAANDNPPDVVDVDVLPDYPDFAKDVLTPAGTSQGGFLKTNAEDFGVYQPTTAYSTHTRNFERANPTGGAWVNLPTAFGLTPNSVVTLRNDIDFDGGLGYFYIQDDNESIFYYYAGILADTDLGAPRTETEGTAIWPGRFIDELIKDHADKDNFVDFHINFARGELQFRNPASTAGGYTLAYGTNRYTLNGVFGNRIVDKNGRILTTGQLGGQITRVSTISGSQVAPITGLIGEKGVVGAFVNTASLSGFAGGFWAVPELAEPVDRNDKLVNFADWSDPFGRATPPPTKISSPSKSEFLTGNAAIVSGKGLNEPASISNLWNSQTRARFALTLGTATYGGEPLDGVGTAADGVAGFATGPTIDDARYRYVGLLSGTDLGAPISKTAGSAAWNGRFVGLREFSGGSIFRTTTDFILTVTFGTAGGTLEMNRIEDYLTFNDHYYTMADGEYNASGVISGTINFHDEDDPTNPTSSILTGLIGQDGAVGAFISGTVATIENKRDVGNITEHASNKPRFYGGFVAAPVYEVPTDLLPTVVNYDDWAGATRRKPLASGAFAPPPESQFLLSTDDRLDTEDIPGSSTSVNLSTATNGGTALGGDTTDGFAYLAISGVNDIFLVGLSSTTDLGAPLDATTALGTWNGSFVSVEFENSIATPTTTDFTLAVTFGGVGKAGSVASGTIGGTGYAFTGDFDSRGVIIGTTTHAENGGGVLQGLIGVQGAVGAFYSNPTGAPSGAKPYGGGFVAKPIPPSACQLASNCVNHALWLSNALDSDGTGVAIRTAIKTEANKTNDAMGGGYFIAGGGDAEALLNFTDAATKRVAKLTLSNIEGSNNTNSGFSALRVDDSGAYSYVGLLSTTDVGAPFTNTSKPAAEWTAIVRNAVITGNQPSVPFTLNVTFTDGGGTINTRSRGADYGTESNLKINGQFGANGVIYGSVTFVDHSNFVYGDFTLSGLIGVNGAVGVFAGISIDRRSFAGGFVAVPRTLSACEMASNCVANTAAWTASYNAGGINQSPLTPLLESGVVNDAPNSSDYIKLTNDNKIMSGPTGSQSFDPTILRLNEAVDQPGYESGIAYANSSATGQTYVGMLPTTELGAPLADGNKNGTWTGTLKGISGYNAPTLASADFSLKVTYGGDSSEPGSVGTIESLDGDDNVGFAPIIDANSAIITGGIRFRGDFNALGVMWGSVNLGNAAADNGTFSGLIGAKGAVGLFEGTNAEAFYSYVGGFEAHPPSN